MGKRSNWKLSKTVHVFIWLILVITICTAMVFPGRADDYSYSTGQKSGSSTVSRTWTQVSDDTWTMDVDGDGNSDVTLVSSTDDSGNLVWTYTFNVEDNEQVYHVYEEMTNNGTVPLKNGYTSSGSEGSDESEVSAIPQEPGKTKDGKYKITNHKDHAPNTKLEKGTLKISKNVEGNMPDPDQEFSFTITLTGNNDELNAAISGSKIFGNTPFSDGIAHISLKKDESLEISDLPAGLTYEISETDTGGYEQSSASGATGAIIADSITEASFTNKSTYTPPDDNEKTASFNITKKVVGLSAPDDETYEFTVSLSGLAPNGTYNLYADRTYKADSNGDADVTVGIKNGDSANFSGLPAGSTYQISEKGGNYTSSYTVESDGSVISPEGKGNKEQDLTTARETADSGEVANITFTNTYETKQSLTVMKKMYGYNNGTLSEISSSQEFEFIIDFENIPEDADITSDVGRVIPDEYGEASKTIKITASGNDGKIVFNNIPAGVRYQITESSSPFAPSYTITVNDTNGKLVSGTIVNEKNSGKPENSFSTGSEENNFETIEENQSYTVVFTNTYNFAIHKVNDDPQTINGDVSGAQYSLSKYENGTKISIPSSASFNGATDGTGFMGWKNLVPGVYILEEIKAPEGYEKNADIVFVILPDGQIKYGTSSDAMNDAASIYSELSSSLEPVINGMNVWKPDSVTENGDSSYQTFIVEEHMIIAIPTGILSYRFLPVLIIVSVGIIVFFIALKKKNHTLKN